MQAVPAVHHASISARTSLPPRFARFAAVHFELLASLMDAHWSIYQAKSCWESLPGLTRNGCCEELQLVACLCHVCCQQRHMLAQKASTTAAGET